MLTSTPRNSREHFQIGSFRIARPLWALLLFAAGMGLLPTAAAQGAKATPAAAASPVAVDTALPHGQIEYLWPAGAPGAVGAEEQDKPRLEIFSGYGSGPHTAVIVCPGGSYTHLAYEKEGTRIAEWLNLRGITAFVLTYRLSPRYHSPSPLLDGYRSVRWVRSHAQQFDIAPSRIGMWGFSAGGHLVGMVGTHFDDGDPQAADPIDRVSDRPDFVISAYGALTLQPGIARVGALGALLGEPVTPQLIDELSPDKHVTARTPPYFLFATTTDQAVPVLNSVVFYTALVRAGVPAEMHIFQEGPHGTGLAQSYPALSAWPGVLENWLRLNGWIPANTTASGR
jgi:acetyl esterase/lipase